jgi:lipid-A-disaccharide synthase
MKIVISAGEPSGDQIGACCMRALSHLDIEWVGVGGEAMQACGLKSWVPLDELAVNGFVEVIPKLPKLFKLRELFKQEFLKSVSALILIDYAGFNIKLITEAKRLNIPIFYVAPPQIWAWKQKRASQLQGVFLCHLFEFEKAFSIKMGLNADSFGHPLVSLNSNYFNLNSNNMKLKRILILPGSRWNQVRMNLSEQIFRAQEMLKEGGFKAEFIVLAPHKDMAFKIQSYLHLNHSDINYSVIHGPLSQIQKIDFAICLVGTVNLYLWAQKIPFIIYHKVNIVTYFLGKVWLKTPYLSLINILAERQIIPEYFYWNKRQIGAISLDFIDVQATECFQLQTSKDWDGQFADWFSRGLEEFSQGKL